MINGYNKVVLVGKISKEPDLRYSQKGVAYTKTSIDTTDGTNYEKVTTINLIIFNSLAESCAVHLKMDQWVLVEGKLSSQEQKNGNGDIIVKYVVAVDKVVFLPSEEKKTELPTSGQVLGNISKASSNKFYVPKDSEKIENNIKGSEDIGRSFKNRSSDENLTKYLDVGDTEYTPF